MHGRDDAVPVNDTLGALYGALIQQAIDESENDQYPGYAAVDDGNVNADLQEEVRDAEQQKRDVIEPKSVVTDKQGRHSLSTGSHYWNATTLTVANAHNVTYDQQGPALGSKVYATGSAGLLATPLIHGNFRMPNVTGLNTTRIVTTNGTNGTAYGRSGTVVANRTHVLLGNGKAVERFGINPVKLFLPDRTARIFHPTQNGHALIANMVLWHMASDNARRMGRILLDPASTKSTSADSEFA